MKINRILFFLTLTLDLAIVSCNPGSVSMQSSISNQTVNVAISATPTLILSPTPSAPAIHFQMLDSRIKADFLYRAPIQTPVFSEFGPDGQLYIADSLGNRIVRISTSGEITELNLKKRIFTTGSGGPRSLAFSPDGDLYVNIWNTVYRINKDLEVTTINEIDGSPIGAIAFSPDGDLYYTDRNDQSGDVHRIRSGKDEEVIKNLPFAEYMAFGKDGSLYVSQMDQGKVYKVDVKTLEYKLFYSSSIIDPIYLAVDAEGDVWIRELTCLTQLDPAGKHKPIVIDGTRYSGNKCYQEIGTSAGLAFDKDGGIWLPSYNSRIMKLTPAVPGLGNDEYISSVVYPGMYFTSLVVNSKGEIYGTEILSGTLMRISYGKYETIVELGCRNNSTLAIDQKDNIYIGTSCDNGKIMVLDTEGKLSDYAQIITESMTFGKDGSLYAISGRFGHTKSLIRISAKDTYTILAKSFENITLGKSHVQIASWKGGLYITDEETRNFYKVGYDGRGNIVQLKTPIKGGNQPIVMTAQSDGTIFLLVHGWGLGDGPYELIKIDVNGEMNGLAVHIAGDPGAFAFSQNDKILYIAECGGVIRMEFK